MSLTKVVFSNILNPPSKHSHLEWSACERGGFFIGWPGRKGFPARMALCESAGRKAAGGGDESAARVDARIEQPVKQSREFRSSQPVRLPFAGWTGAEFMAIH